MEFDEVAHRLAIEQAARMSAEIIEELTAKKGFRPTVAILRKAREDAAMAMVALIGAHPEDAKMIRGLQNEVARFTSLIGWLKTLVHEGLAAERELDELNASFIEDMAISPEDRRELEQNFNMPQQRMNDA